MTLVTARLPAAARRALVAGSAALALLVTASGGSASAGSPASAGDDARSGPVASARVLTRLAPVDDTIAESLAVTGHGAILVSKTVWGAQANTGRLVKVRPGGAKRGFGPRLDLGPTGMLLGVAVDGRDRVYVAAYDFGGTTRSSVYRVLPHAVVKVATFPLGAWPNGMAFHGGWLYVGDSTRGDVWRLRPTAGLARLHTPWVRSRLLAPASPDAIGVNGIAFWRDTLYAVNASTGALVRVPQGPRGNAGEPVRVTRTDRLLGADGIAFGGLGRLWVVTNGTSEKDGPLHDQRLLVMTRSGVVRGSVEDAPWMNYPTMLAFGRTPATHHRLFVSDGAFFGGRADVVGLRLR